MVERALKACSARSGDSSPIRPKDAASPEAARKRTAEQAPSTVSTYGQVPGAWGFPHVRGRCPSCGTASLFLAVGGHVTCSVIGCADPCAVDTWLHGEDARDA